MVGLPCYHVSMMKTTDTLKTSLGELPVSMKNAYAVVTVPASNGRDVYSVIITRSFARCDCKGYEYRGKCKHVTVVKEAMGVQ